MNAWSPRAATTAPGLVGLGLDVGVVGVILLVVATVGVVLLLVVVIRGKRVDDHPLCRRCGFDLTGIEKERCPECGRSLAGRRAVRIGNRRRRRTHVAAAVVFALPVLVMDVLLIVAATGSFELNTVKPAWMLAMDVRSGNAARSVAAVQELQDRIAGGEISLEGLAPSIETALRVQADATASWQRYWGNLVEEAHDAGLVSDENWATYVEQSLVVEFLMRERQYPGERLPLAVKVSSRSGIRGPRTNVKIGLGPLRVGHELLDGTYVTSAGVQGSGGSSTTTHMIELPVLEVGPTDIEFPARIQVFDHNSAGGALLADISRTVAHTLEIVDPTLPLVDFVEADAATGAALRRAMDVTIGRDRRGRPEISISRDGVSVAIGARVVLRQGESEVDAGPFAAIGETGKFVNRMDIPDIEPGVYDVILRPDGDAARTLIGVEAVWGEEIVFEGVEFE